MKTKSVDQLYAGRTRPDGRSTAQERYPAASGTMKAKDESQPQTPSNQREPGYHNDVSLSSWLRNGDACSKPSFDYMKSHGVKGRYHGGR